MTSLNCIICGRLAYWSYERDIKDLEMLVKSHVERHDKKHITTFEQ